jgi:hypothetical protein
MIEGESISLVVESPMICTKNNSDKEEVVKTTIGYYSISHFVAFHRFS